jgi:1,4-dihydroxy-2-naphthoate octaprenyltransferase
MPIDLAAVNWLYVIILAVFVFVSTFIGNFLSFSRRGMGALLSALVFTGIFVMWTYYPHHLPLPITVSEPKPAAAAPAPAAPAASTTPVRPRNPVTDITPPAAPAPAR